MTREEAIRAIGWMKCTTNREDDLEAIDMAIEALTEPINCVKCKHYYETEDDTDVHGHCKMDTAHTNLISRADAVLYHANYCPNCGARMKGGDDE